MTIAAAAAVVATAGAITVAPMSAQKDAASVVSQAVRLVDSSLLNVPINLFYDLVNIPYFENEALGFLSRSLFNSGPWMVVSPTNLWGVDPGDPSHFMSVVNFLMPNPYLSGMFGWDQDPSLGMVNDPAHELDFTAGFGQQLWGLVATQLSINGACEAMECLPLTPTSPITGMTSIDQMIWSVLVWTGQQKFPLIDDWFKVDPTNGFTFDSNYPGYTDPSGSASGLFGFPGTHYVDGVGNVQPFADSTFHPDFFAPLQNYWDHLMGDPATDGVFGSGIYLPSIEDFFRNLQSLAAASVIAFDPFTAGSPFCPLDCSYLPSWLDYPGIVKAIDAMWPGNQMIETWIQGYDKFIELGGNTLTDETPNLPTWDMIENSMRILQQSNWSFGNPSPPDEYSPSWWPNINELAPQFEQFWTQIGTALGIPNFPGEAEGFFGLGDFLPYLHEIESWFGLGPLADAGSLAAVDPTGGVDLSTLLTDMFGASGGVDLSGLLTDAFTDPTAFWAGLDGMWADLFNPANFAI